MIPGTGGIDDAWAGHEHPARAMSRILPADVLCYVDTDAHACPGLRAFSPEVPDERVRGPGRARGSG
ncbi:hypothetical protein C8E87_5716 [Paractinoplanes brasiliensis]|uniref:Uncharacterized protein n=1 Tax=Paractinoplanes brasiliensis TaxID=52695 RepID=A0A4R6K3Y4_9ACTN|nr:hypothetical protein C8E87_5716 [Actinoplanes brasiliensis]